VSARAQDAFAGAAPPGLLLQRRYPALYHELFMEPERDQVIADVVSWVVSRSAPGAAAAG
jgi:alpha-beta hydrolase superfamily lysophospholipase